MRACSFLFLLAFLAIAGFGCQPEPPQRAMAPAKVFIDITSQTPLGSLNYRWKGGVRPAFSAAWADLDVDGDPDLLLTQTERVYLFRNDHGALKPVLRSPWSYPGSAAGVVVGRIDKKVPAPLFIYGDGPLQKLFIDHPLAFPLSAMSTPLLFPGPGSTAVEGLQWNPPNMERVSMDYVLFAVRGGDRTGGHIIGWRQHPPFPANAPCSGTEGLQATSVVVIDADGDGKEDCLFVSDSESPRLLLNRERSLRRSSDRLGLEQIGEANQIVAFDLDGDQTKEIVVAARHDLRIAWRRKNGRFWVAPLVPNMPAQRFQSVDCGDFDGDDNGDVVALANPTTGMGAAREVRLFLGDGKGIFRDATKESGLAHFMPRTEARLTSADYDSDGDLDLMIAGPQPLLLRNDFARPPPIAREARSKP